MSRHRGRRERPASERKTMLERYSKPERRRRVPPTEQLAREGPISSRRRWTAVAAGTIVSILAFGFVATAIVQAGDGNDSAAIFAAVASAVMIPLLLLVVGLVSRATSPWRSAAIASLIVLGAFVGGSFAAREPATGFVLAIGLGAAWTMRSEEGIHLRSWRLWTAVGLAAYTKVVYLISPGLAIVAAPLIPIAGIAIIDSVAERRSPG